MQAGKSAGQGERPESRDGLRVWVMDFGLGRRMGQGQGKHARSVFVGWRLQIVGSEPFLGAGKREPWSGATEARDGLDFGLGRSRG